MEIDITPQEYDEADRGHPVPDWYAAVIEDTYEDQKNLGTDVLKIMITDGRWAGHRMFMRFSPMNSASDEATPVIKKKLTIWGIRLGLIPKGHQGRLNLNWTRTIGMPIAIKVVSRRYEKPTGSGNWQDITDIDFAGVYQRHDERVPANIRSQPPTGGIPGDGSAVTASLPVNPNAAPPYIPPAGVTHPPGPVPFHNPAPAAAQGGQPSVATPAATAPGRVDYSNL